MPYFWYGSVSPHVVADICAHHERVDLSCVFAAEVAGSAMMTVRVHTAPAAVQS